jgi:hypothetical protein
MKTYKRRIMIIGLWIASVALSFCAGAFFIYEYYFFQDPITGVTTYISACPPVDGSYYSVEDIIRANDDVETHLSDQQKKPEFHNLHPRFIVVPELHGYTIYSSSGVRGRGLPYDLYKSSLKVVEKSLGEINVMPMYPDAH